jgi:starvation-inducible DNA-binding protein
MKPQIDIPVKNLSEIALILNTLLCDEYVLYTKTRNAHWNVEGPAFHALHLFFENQYGELDELIDEIAERTRSLGHYALGSLKEFVKVARLDEPIMEFNNAKKMLQALLDDHELIIRILRKDVNTVAEKYKDAGTSDFLTGILEKHEKMAWMLRAHLG